MRRDHDGAIVAANSQAGGKPANADGTYDNVIPLFGCGPDEPPGATFTFTVAEHYPNRTPSRGPEVRATFTVMAAGQ